MSTRIMKKQVKIMSPNVHSSSANDSLNIEMDEIPEKKFNRIIKMINDE